MDPGAEKRKRDPLRINLKSTNGLYMKTVNPCNDFLIDFLISSKLKSQKQGIGKFTTYNLAIQSVRKYPLPIICEAQLAALEGFGDFFINEAAKRIQKHYKRGRMPTEQEIQEDEREHFQELQNIRRKGYNSKKKKKNGDEDQIQIQQQQEENVEQSKISQQNIQKCQQNSNQAQKPSQASITPSKNSQKLQTYKPKPQTQLWKILKALYQLKARTKFVTKGQINQVFYEESRDTVKGWDFARMRLRECGYVQCDRKEGDRVRLTDKGWAFMEQSLGELGNNNGGKEADNDNDIHFRKGPDDKTQLISHIPSQAIKMLISKQILQSPAQRKTCQQHLPLLCPNPLRYSLIKVGTFLWCIHGRLLDMVVIRYIDISCKFTREQLKIDCGLLRVVGWGHVTVVVESDREEEGGLLGDKLEDKMERMSKTLFDCRAAGFKVLVLKNFKGTLNYIGEVTKILNQRVELVSEQNPLPIIGTLQEVNNKIQKSTMLAKLYCRCMRLLPGMVKQAADKMTLKFGTFRLTEQKMRQKLKTRQKQLKFLGHLFQDVQISEQSIRKIIDFFFATSYE